VGGGWGLSVAVERKKTSTALFKIMQKERVKNEGCVLFRWLTYRICNAMSDDMCSSDLFLVGVV
jgi:hypothetical protein